MSVLRFSIKPFSALTPVELYAALRLRQEVFIVEQNCPYLDADDYDQKSLHLFAWQGEHLAGYLRLLPEGLKFPECSIGRVVSSPKSRKSGVGRAIMEEAIRYFTAAGKTPPIRIGAQAYLERFYSSLGFKSTGKHFLEDGIPHIEMLRPSS